MLSPEDIKTYIENDAASRRKQAARVGLRYYEGDHDIRNYRIFYIDADGNLQEDRYRSNVKIANPFFKILVDQQAQYILSGEAPIFNSDIPELQTELDARFNNNDEFTAELYEAIVGCVAKGFEHMLAYKDKDGKTAFQCADSLGVVEVRGKETDDHCDYVIYWYVDRIGKDNKKIKRIQVWDAAQVWFYVQEDEGKIIPDTEEKTNPRPHTLYTKDGDTSVYYEDFGFVPFFRLDNNKKQQSGLILIKDQIDSYDLMNAGLVNNIQDTSEALYVVKGFQGDNLDELMMNIKAKKHIGVDEDGGLEIKTIDIPYEARKVKMEIDEKNIFRFGLGVNTDSLKDTSATVSVAIKSAYANLDLKCNGFNKGLKRFLRKLLDVVLKDINAQNGTDYMQENVWINLDEREIITNAQETAQIKLIEAQEQQTRVTTILNTAAQFGNEITMQRLCEAYDLDYNEIKDKLPEPEVNDPFGTQSALAAMADGGGVIE